MIVHHNIDHFHARYPVVTVGIFDGVHLGHQYILKQLKKIAALSEGETVVVTLWPHPRMVLNKNNKDFRLLTTQAEKIRILTETGIDHLVIIPFNRKLSQFSGCEFIEKVLIGKIGMNLLLVGYNHRFGKGRQGDFEELKKCADRFGFGIQRLGPFQLDERKISSSKIRDLLLSGKVEEAGRLLGRTYEFSGQVVGGSRLGSSIGFPTANITPDDPGKLLPANGVYAVKAEMKNKLYHGMMNMGTRPTVNKDPHRRTIEVHLLDFQENVYSENIRIRLISRMRDERRFKNIDALKAQLQKDREKAVQIFGRS